MGRPSGHGAGAGGAIGRADDHQLEPASAVHGSCGNGQPVDGIALDLRPAAEACRDVQRAEPDLDRQRGPALDRAFELLAQLGLELDGRGFGLGTRSQRYAMIVEDGVVKVLNVEEGPGVDVSAAETILAAL